MSIFSLFLIEAQMHITLVIVLTYHSAKVLSFRLVTYFGAAPCFVVLSLSLFQIKCF